MARGLIARPSLGWLALLPVLISSGMVRKADMISSGISAIEHDSMTMASETQVVIPSSGASFLGVWIGSAGEELPNEISVWFRTVSAAELLDKTWFVALLMALQQKKAAVFWGCYSALTLHVLATTIFGHHKTSTVSEYLLHCSAAALFTFFASLHLREWHLTNLNADASSKAKESTKQTQEASKASEASKAKEAQETSETKATGVTKGTKGTSERGSSTSSGPSSLMFLGWTATFWKCFTAVFVVELGDRTHTAMLAQHVTHALVPAAIGAVAAFGLLTMFAVICSAFIDQLKIRAASMQMLCAVGFMLLAVQEAAALYHHLNRV